MARKLRIQYPGAIYHVMNRGDLKHLLYWHQADQNGSASGGTTIIPMIGTVVQYP